MPMKNMLIVFLVVLAGIGKVTAQDQSIHPIMLDKQALSGVGLQQIEMKDEPGKIFHQKQLYRGPELSVYVVSTNTWDNRMDNFPFDEFVYMLHGEALIKPDHGRAQLFHSGDCFFAPRGYTGAWSIRAGANLHYELSVIATNRADSTRVQDAAQHTLFDRSTLSGTQIDLDDSGGYNETLMTGAELSVSLRAEAPHD